MNGNVKRDEKTGRLTYRVGVREVVLSPEVMLDEDLLLEIERHLLGEGLMKEREIRQR